LALLCLAVLALSIRAMGGRIAAFNAQPERRTWLFRVINDRAFDYAGRRAEVRDETDESGRVVVAIAYGDDVLRLPATIPPRFENLPGLKRHEDWLRVLRFAERGARSEQEVEDAVRRGEIRDRLVAVVRRPKVDDPRTLGQGWRKQWAFDFYEFLPEGGFASHTLDYPTGRSIDKPRPGQLVQGTWEFDAALFVMPPMGKPSPKFTGDALHAMGWTLPAAAFSGLGLLGAVVYLLIVRRRGGTAQS
jgi:hypothetical protein